MLNSVPIAIVAGVILGFLSGLGIGGGTILILWLTQIVKMDPTISRTINLLFFISTACSVSIIRMKRHQIPWRSIWPAIITGCITAGIFTFIGEKLDTDILRKIFGGLLLITGFRELFYRAK
ncbi:MAG: sulfite exporter TauE/SafE family protein [Oscillospiraceae bacterium]|nr:sulfite exporter TauE/SafE family protein [Oscillospiraceae bacterium]